MNNQEQFGLLWALTPIRGCQAYVSRKSVINLDTDEQWYLYGCTKDIYITEIVDRAAASGGMAYCGRGGSVRDCWDNEVEVVFDDNGNFQTLEGIRFFIKDSYNNS